MPTHFTADCGMMNAELRTVFHHSSAFTFPLEGEALSKKRIPSKGKLKPSDCRIRILPLSFLMPLSKCYCNYRMRIQNFRLVYTSVFTQFGRRRCEYQPPEAEAYVTLLCSNSASSLPHSLGCALRNRSALRQNHHYHSALRIPTSAFLAVGLSGLEPLTPALSAQCSNRLSYRPQSIVNGECKIVNY